MTSPILVAEVSTQHAEHLGTILTDFDQWAIAVGSAERALAMLRKRLFARAIVAAEMEIDGKPLLARLARLPALKMLLAVGPPGSADMERRARLAGAHVYLTRPVAAEQLAAALGMAMAEVTDNH